MNEKVTVFVLSEDGTYLDKELIDLLQDPIRKRGFEIMNAPELNHVMLKAMSEKGARVKNAENEAPYLLEKIEESEYPVIVIAWDEPDEGTPRPRYFVGDYEMSMLVKGLSENPKEDAWATAIRVITEIRNAEKAGN
ncbi:MAG: hypothetical protein K6F53_09605 [Lachnospiraceae bacterium]|nr:hypothetical protein [Lachnospiraceae bacterium]